MAIFTWNNGNVPEGMKVTQVYGLVFTKDGRLLLRVEKKGDRIKYSLAGGKPELDEGREETLKREFLEEVNTTLQDGALVVGYQQVDEEDGSPPYAQMRMSAIIDSIGIRQPDPDTGKTYDRLLTTPKRAIELLNWGEVGESQVNEALRIAKEHLGLQEFSTKEEYV